MAGATPVDFQKAGRCAPTFVEAAFPTNLNYSNPIYLHGLRVIGLVVDGSNPGGNHMIEVLGPGSSAAGSEVWFSGFKTDPASAAYTNDYKIIPVSVSDNPHLTGTVRVVAPDAPLGEYQIWLMVEKVPR